MIGQSLEEAAYDYQSVAALTLPDLSCTEDNWLRNIVHLHDKISRKERSLLVEQKFLVDLSKFRVEAEVMYKVLVICSNFAKRSHFVVYSRVACRA